MKFSVEKALQICGNNNKYQKLLFLAVTLTWFSVDFISISFPLLEVLPSFQCREDNKMWVECDEVQYCQIDNHYNHRAVITYSNLVTDFEMYCRTTMTILIGLSYTCGILVGAILASKFADLLGRKPVLLLTHFLFACGAISLTLAPNVYMLFGVLFFIGLACAGGTMVSYLLIIELLAINKRAMYGTMINSSFAVAGLIYFVTYQYLKNWKVLAYIATGTDLIAGLLVLTYFKESPRFYISKGQWEKAIKVLYKIAKNNNKGKDFYKYLISDLAIKKNYPNDDCQYYEKRARNSCEEKDKDKDKDKDSLDNLDTKSRKDTSDNLSASSNNNPSTRSSSSNDTETSTFMDKFVENIKMKEVHPENPKEELFLPRPTASSFQAEETKPEAAFFALVKYKSLRCTFIINCVIWFATAFTYYGISLGLKKDKADIFIEGYIVFCSEGISYIVTGIIISVAFFGRIRSLKIMMLLASLTCCGFYLMKMFSVEWYDKIVLSGSRFSITASYLIMYTFSSEVYPTTVRAKGIGLNTLFARLATILIPVVVEIFNPFLIFSGLCLLSFCLAFFLPETFGKELEDDIQEEKAQKKFPQEKI